jgi:hypothetical protein
MSPMPTRGAAREKAGARRAASMDGGSSMTMMVKILRHAVVFGMALAVIGCQELLGPVHAGFPLVPPVSAGLTAAERLAYEEDAVRLALRHLAATGSPSRHLVEPPAELVTSLFNALTAVHATSHPVRDTIIEVHRIRAFPNPAVYEFMVNVDPAAAWTHAWRQKQALTGNATVDEMVAKYGITVREYYHWSFGEVALLRTARPLNMKALSARFAALPGVIWAEPNGYMGDGNDIRASAASGGWRLDYSIGFGDCPAGCINRFTWSFSVGATGTVQYLGSTGSPPPPPPQD